MWYEIKKIKVLNTNSQKLLEHFFTIEKYSEMLLLKGWKARYPTFMFFTLIRHFEYKNESLWNTEEFWRWNWECLKFSTPHPMKRRGEI